MGSNYSVWKALTDGKGRKSQLETGVKVKIYPPFVNPITPTITYKTKDTQMLDNPH